MKKARIILLLALALSLPSSLRADEGEERTARAMAAVAQDQAQVEEAMAADTQAQLDKTEKVIILHGDGSSSEVSYYPKKPRNNSRAHISIKLKSYSRYDAMFDIGFNTYDQRNIFTGTDGGDPFLRLNTGKSMNVGLYPWMGTLNLTRSGSLNLQGGLGFDWGNYRFEDGWSVANANGVTVPSDRYRPAGQSEVSKSKLMTLYLNVPLIFGIDIPTGKKKHIHLGVGVIGGLKLGSHTKVKYYGGGKDKERDSFNLNLLRYSLTFRAGVGGIGLYFNYQMTPLFENGGGPKLYPYSVGLSFRM